MNQTHRPRAEPGEGRGGPTRWLVVAALCLIVVAALAGYFIGRAPR